MIEAGKSYFISKDIQAGGQRIFARGDEVLVNSIAKPSPQAPDAVYVVYSPSNGKPYLLRTSDFASTPEMATEQATGGTISPAACVHSYARSQQGQLVCRKCGAITQYRAPPPQDLAPLEVCPKCGTPFGEGLTFCSNCGEPNVNLIKLRAYEGSLSEGQCRHKYVPFKDGKICDRCGKIVFRGPIVKKYTPQGELLFCNACGFALKETDNVCPNCRQKLKRISLASSPDPQQPAQGVDLAFCTQCGSSILPGSTSCQSCGNALSQVQTPPGGPVTAIAVKNKPVLSNLSGPGMIGRLLSAGLALSGLLIFISTFFNWITFGSSSASVGMSGWFMTTHPGIFEGNFLFTGGGAFMFTGIWALAFGILLCVMGIFLAIEYNNTKAILSIVIASIGGVMAVVNLVQIYAHSSDALYKSEVLIGPGAGLWVFLLFGIAAIVLSALVKRTGFY